MNPPANVDELAGPALAHRDGKIYLACRNNQSRSLFVFSYNIQDGKWAKLKEDHRILLHYCFRDRRERCRACYQYKGDILFLMELNQAMKYSIEDNCWKPETIHLPCMNANLKTAYFALPLPEESQTCDAEAESETDSE